MRRTSSTAFSPLYQSEEPVHTQKSALTATHKATPNSIMTASGTVLDLKLLFTFPKGLFYTLKATKLMIGSQDWQIPKVTR